MSIKGSNDNQVEDRGIGYPMGFEFEADGVVGIVNVPMSYVGFKNPGGCVTVWQDHVTLRFFADDVAGVQKAARAYADRTGCPIWGC